MAKTGKREQWSRRVAAFERSEQSRRTWCAARGLNVSTLDYWRYRLRDVSASAPARTRGGTAVKRKPSTSATPLALVPLRVVASSVSTKPLRVCAGHRGEISLHAADGLRLVLPRDIDADWLAMLVRDPDPGKNRTRRPLSFIGVALARGSAATSGWRRKVSQALFGPV